MVARLVRGGHEVVAVGRSAETRSAIAESGTTAVESPAAVARAEVVVVCVFTDEQVCEVCLDGPLFRVWRPVRS
ncbi:NAD(P)-binding domain-containing protein [Nocardia sp. CA-129566]|uniref:NAD(P)-binding domain-containing protein n=1 Tax=Nocardia sp. CA-129566 TaxID=3239976 RepID=UPI003D992DC3